MASAVRRLGSLSMARGCARIDAGPDTAKIGSADRVQVHHARLIAVIGVRKTYPHGLGQQATLQACPDMNEAANQGGLRDDRCAGRSERCRTILQHRKLAAFTSDLYKSRDTYGNFLRLVRPTRPC